MREHALRSSVIARTRPHRRLVSLLAVTGLLAFAGCASAGGGMQGAPLPDPERAATELRQATIPESPRQVTFAWELDEAGTRLRGRGVVRFVAPERLRLDLFGPRGETYLAAALVDGAYRLPAAVEERFPLPAPALLWAALSVMDPPDLPLTAAAEEGDTLRFRYQGEERGGYEFIARGSVLQQVRRLDRDRTAESVDLTYAEDGSLRQARYRNWAEYRALTLTFEGQRDVASFPADIWTP